jgi:hypothetical protein
MKFKRVKQYHFHVQFCIFLLQFSLALNKTRNPFSKKKSIQLFFNQDVDLIFFTS